MQIPKLFSTSILAIAIMMSTTTNTVNAQITKLNTQEISEIEQIIGPELQAKIHTDFQELVSKVIEHEKLVTQTYDKSKLNPNILFPLKPSYILTEEDLKAYPRALKVNITRSDAYKMLNTINTERIKNNRDSLTFTSDLILESSILGKAIASKTLESYHQDCDKYMYVTGPQTVEDALTAFFNDPGYVSILTKGDYSKIGVGCTYNSHIGEKSKQVYNWVITLTQL